MKSVDYFWRTAAYITRNLFMLCLLERPSLFVSDSGNILLLITVSMSRCD